MKLNIVKLTYMAIAFSASLSRAFAEIKDPEAMGLPTFGTKKNVIGGLVQSNTANPHGFLVKSISEGIKYIGLLAVISLTVGGVMYMTSYGADEKTKKAKNVIMYSIIGVVVAMGAFAMVEIVNNINLN